MAPESHDSRPPTDDGRILTRHQRIPAERVGARRPGDARRLHVCMVPRMSRRQVDRM